MRRLVLRIYSFVIGSHLLDAAFQSVRNSGSFGDFIEVSVTSNEQIEGEGELGESPDRGPLHLRLVIHLEISGSTAAYQTNHVPFAKTDRHLAPEESKERQGSIIQTAFLLKTKAVAMGKFYACRSYRS